MRIGKCYLKMRRFVDDIACDPQSTIRQHESAVKIIAELQGRDHNVVSNECLKKAKKRARHDEKMIRKAMSEIKEPRP